VRLKACDRRNRHRYAPWLVGFRAFELQTLSRLRERSRDKYRSVDIVRPSKRQHFAATGTSGGIQFKERPDAPTAARPFDQQSLLGWHECNPFALLKIGAQKAVDTTPAMFRTVFAASDRGTFVFRCPASFWLAVSSEKTGDRPFRVKFERAPARDA
jgi:hypothetical protein